MTEPEQDDAIATLQARCDSLESALSGALQALSITASEKRAHKRAIQIKLLEQIYLGLTQKPQNLQQLQALLTAGFATGLAAVADAVHPGDNT